MTKSMRYWPRLMTPTTVTISGGMAESDDVLARLGSLAWRNRAEILTATWRTPVRASVQPEGPGR